MKKFFHSIRWLLVIAILIIAVDQITKFLVRKYIPLGDIWSPWDWLRPYVRLIHTNNTGAAFGMFKNGNPIFMVLAAIVSIAILYYYPRVPENEKLMRFALSLQLAGALGNFIDRIQFGQVTDFISVGNFAIFNVADSSITVGVCLLIIAVWLQDRNERNKAPEEHSPEAAKESGKEN